MLRPHQRRLSLQLLPGAAEVAVPEVEESAKSQKTIESIIISRPGEEKKPKKSGDSLKKKLQEEKTVSRTRTEKRESRRVWELSGDIKKNAILDYSGDKDKNVAAEPAEKICQSVGRKLEGKVVSTSSRISLELQEAVRESLTQLPTPKRRVDILYDVVKAKQDGRPYVIVFCGVNGVGKNTNLAKERSSFGFVYRFSRSSALPFIHWFAHTLPISVHMMNARTDEHMNLNENNHRVMIAAGDTSLAGAVEQLGPTKHLNALHPNSVQVWKHLV
ncbi:hypothetical protein Q1695_012207 [Nippostrongylus brasiliensis]|nr:hypothetical protein Q1695_012207 [Nippostrongylus brasiliensis]